MKNKICLYINILALLLVTPAFAVTDTARADADEGGWEFVLELYGWAPDIEGTTADGTDFEIDLETIIENLDIVLFSTFGGRKNRWQFMVDVIYMKLSDDSNTNLNQLLRLSDIEMEAWVVNPFVSYEIFGSKKGSFQIMAGARYLDNQVDLELSTRPPLDPEDNEESVSFDVWDGIVGIRGFYNLNERWFLPYRLDFGTGDSDFTWHALAGIGYQFDSFKLIGAYRHMEWEFEDDSALEDMQVSGPVVGAIFVF